MNTSLPTKPLSYSGSLTWTVYNAYHALLGRLAKRSAPVHAALPPIKNYPNVPPPISTSSRIFLPPSPVPCTPEGFTMPIPTSPLDTQPFQMTGAEADMFIEDAIARTKQAIFESWELYYVAMETEGADEQLGVNKRHFDLAIDLLTQNHLGGEDLLIRLRAAEILAINGLAPQVSLATLLLNVDPAEIEKTLGPDVARLTSGALKLQEFSYHPTMEESHPSRTQMNLVLLARVREVPAMECHIIDAVFRLTELTLSLQAVRRRPQAEIAGHLQKKEALASEARYLQVEVFARLGYNKLAAELADCSAAHIDYPGYKKYEEEIHKRTGLTQQEREHYCRDLQAEIEIFLRQNHIRAKVVSRAKVVARIKDKVERALAQLPSETVDAEETAWQEITDIFGIRIICEKAEDCHRVAALLETAGGVLEGWQRQSKIDYITNPKENGYESIHYPFIKTNRDGTLLSLSLQIRDEPMDYEAEWGKASHWAAYKKLLEGVGAERLDRFFAEQGRSPDEAKTLRWQKLAEFSQQYTFAYLTISRKNPGKSLSGADHRQRLATIGWSHTKMAMVYCGEPPARLVFPLDLALDSINLKDGVPTVYGVSPTGKIIQAKDHIVANGDIVYVNLSSKSAAGPTHLQQVALPTSQAILHAAFLSRQSPHLGVSAKELGGGQIARGKDLFTNALALAIKQASDVFVAQAPAVPFIQGRFWNVDLAAQRAGYNSAEVIYALFYIFRHVPAIQSAIMQTLYPRIRSTFVHYCIVPRNGSNVEFYVQFEEDRPGLLWAIYTALSQQKLPIKAIYSTTSISRVTSTVPNKRTFYFILQTRLDSLSEPACLDDLRNNWMRAMRCYNTEGTMPKRETFSFDLTFTEDYEKVLPLLFAFFANEGIFVSQIAAPLRETGQPVTINATFQSSKSSWLAQIKGPGRITREILAPLMNTLQEATIKSKIRT